MELGSRRDSRWLNPARVPECLLPTGLRSWLLDEASLTRRMRDACGAAFHVRKLRQERARPLASERRMLGIRDAEFALIREVYLFCGDVPWIFARTVIPLRNLNGKRRKLARLGNKPLGAALFADRSLRRGAVEIAKISPGQYLHAAAVGKVEETRSIWGRRSIFHLGTRPLLVSEIFLPDHGRRAT